MPRYAARTDGNQKQVIEWYNSLGWQVIVTSGSGNGFGDLVAVKNYDGDWAKIFIEVKRDKAADYTPKQRRFNAKYPGLVVRVESELDVVWSIERELRVIGRM